MFAKLKMLPPTQRAVVSSAEKLMRWPELTLVSSDMSNISPIDLGMVNGISAIMHCFDTGLISAGIGLEEHEEPYLRGGSRDIIQTGHTFSNEPGIYIEDSVRKRQSQP
jgi:hypothetical protein